MIERRYFHYTLVKIKKFQLLIVFQCQCKLYLIVTMWLEGGLYNGKIGSIINYPATENRTRDGVRFGFGGRIAISAGYPQMCGFIDCYC